MMIFQFFISEIEIVHRFHDQRSPTGALHAKQTKQLQIQNLAHRRFHAIRIFYHDVNCVQYTATYDEGMTIPFQSFL